jgi:pimeloyl-ACP methyl ester carboxylesterase
MQFGDSKRPLYGVYHPPAGRSGRAVVLCNPFGEEAVRAFRIYRLLAEQLAEGGAHVLRFDYLGTGDSASDCGEACLSGFADSIIEAAAELGDMTGAKETLLIGLRLGAAAAAMAAARFPVGPSALILWDPVVSGRDYLDELRAGHETAVRVQTGHAPPSTEPISEALGFAVSARMAAELSKFDLRQSAGKPARKVFVIAGEATDPSLADAMRAKGADVLWREPTGETSWNSDQALNAFVVPARTLKQIAADALS